MFNAVRALEKGGVGLGSNIIYVKKTASLAGEMATHILSSWTLVALVANQRLGLLVGPSIQCAFCGFHHLFFFSTLLVPF